MKVRKKPVVVDVSEPWMQEGDNVDVSQFDYYHSDHVTCEKCHKLMAEHGWVKTLEGGHIVCPGDRIITGIQGEKYPIKPDIFQQTYEFYDGVDLVPVPKSLVDLCWNILGLARHGDYRNGNVGGGVDEGDVRSAQMLQDYEMQLREFEKVIVSDCPGKPCEGCASEGTC
jgi:hypothetical protein